MNERKIIIGLITSKKYLSAIEDIWKVEYIESVAAKRISMWCWEHYKQYDNAIGKDIGDMFFSKLKNGKIPKDVAEEIEQDILPSLSSEYSKKSIRVKTLIKQTYKYFQKRQLTLFQSEIGELLSKGEVKEARIIAENFTPLIFEKTNTLYFKNVEQVMEAVDTAFKNQSENLIHYPKQMGEMLNEHLVKGGFVAFLGKEKVGKTFLLLDIAIRALKQGRKVAFFQAGDMNRDAQLRRIAIHLAKKSDKEKYCGKQWEGERDCIHNQTDIGCEFPDLKQHNAEPIFEGEDEDIVRTKTKKELIEAYNKFPDYKPCSHCGKHYDYGRKGVIYLKPVTVGEPLTNNEAKQIINTFLKKNGNEFMLSTHENTSLTVKQAKSKLAFWKKKYGFIGEVIIFDYPDIMLSLLKEERQKQNQIWKELRALSQTPDEPLVIAVTQSDAQSYDKDLLTLKNFSEDKRKYAHVTAMWGLNRDKTGREEALGILRMNELVLREGEKTGKVLTIIQNLKRGQPYTKSFF